MRYSIAVMLLAAVPLIAQPVPLRTLSGPAERVAPDSPNEYPLNLSQMGLTIPRISDNDAVDRRLHSQRTVFYKLPQVYQQWVPAHKVEHRNLTLGTSTFSTSRAVWGLYRTSVLHEFNANPDFPWETTIGLNAQHKATGTAINDTINFLSLPEDENGRLTPVLVLSDERPIKWLFPPGTMVGEVIFTNFQGRRYVQEVRTRLKSADSRTWFPGLFRPVKDRDEYQYLTGSSYQPSRKFLTFRNPEEDEVFELKGTVERLPNLPPAAVVALLSRPFQDCSKSNWSPAADTDFHILPKDYSFGLFGRDVDSKTCAGCHRQTQISVRNLIPREPLIINNPTKVGNIRGCDAVFTWHPFDMRSVATRENQPMGRMVYLRAFDANNRLVQTIRHGQKPERDYKLTLYVQEALKSYELPGRPFLHDVVSASAEEPDDDLGEMDRGSAQFTRVVVPAAGMEELPLPVPAQPMMKQEIKEQVVKVTLSSIYQWQRLQASADNPFSDYLVRSSDGRIIGAWDAAASGFRTFNYVTERTGSWSAALSVPPVPVPDNVRSKR